MKKSGLVAASMAAASATAYSVSSSSSSKPNNIPHEDVGVSSKKREKSSATQKSSATSEGKFAPRFDGLRFIETLVTAHR
ncbi:hypothetical protein ACH5RR_028783 [Cinchona calisaya]|uniref:Uncharacterized protein n=1 Tax=Cinchona calisaya TaxID=153742 RepID=A0ABD2YPS8_9GENT